MKIRIKNAFFKITYDLEECKEFEVNILEKCKEYVEQFYVNFQVRKNYKYN